MMIFRENLIQEIIKPETGFRKLSFWAPAFQEPSMLNTSHNAISVGSSFQERYHCIGLSGRLCSSNGRKFLFPGETKIKRMINTSLRMVTSASDSSPLDSDPERGKTMRHAVHNLADVWREIHGQNDWCGMLDPMDPLLQSELIRYGEMAQACYDAFDLDPFSKYCSSCKIKPSMFFEQLGMADAGYEVTHYLHAKYTAKLPQIFRRFLQKESAILANWIGYVAVSSDEVSARIGRRDIMIAWRGEVTMDESMGYMKDDFLQSVSRGGIASPDSNVKVLSRLLNVYTSKEESCRFSMYSPREQILAEVEQLKKRYQHDDLSITVIGHGLGSSFAILSAYDIAETGLNVKEDMREIPICVFSFSGPRIGNNRIRNRLEQLQVKVLRILNTHDIMPRVPGKLFNGDMDLLSHWSDLPPFIFSHVGVELPLDHKISPFLKDTTDALCFHNLEALLHLLDGYHGKTERFRLVSGRDIALVNKTCDFLKDHFLVPPNWWQTQNRGLIRDLSGRWANQNVMISKIICKHNKQAI